jgi:hypothetical protein
MYINVKITDYLDKIRPHCNCGHRSVSFCVTDNYVPTQNSSVLKMETNLRTAAASAVTKGNGK